MELDFLLRLYNATAAGALLMVLIWAIVAEWRSLRPFGKLFALGMTLYIGDTLAATVAALADDSPLTIHTVLMSIAHTWLLGAVLALHSENIKNSGLSSHREEDGHGPS